MWTLINFFIQCINPIHILTSHSLTAAVSPVHVELAPSRREAVAVSGGRRGAGRGGREVRPGHGDGVVDVQFAEQAWREDGRKTTLAASKSAALDKACCGTCQALEGQSSMLDRKKRFQEWRRQHISKNEGKRCGGWHGDSRMYTLLATHTLATFDAAMAASQRRAAS